MSRGPAPPEPLIVGFLGALAALACVAVFKVVTPVNVDPNGYAFLATGVIVGVAAWAIAKYRMNLWLSKDDS